MLVKFMGNRGGGSARASINYLLDKPEGQAEVLQGNPKLSQKIAESLPFKNKYTVGVLSFEEKPSQVSNEQKREIMAKFEDAIFAGLKKEQYNITWIQHTDKGRLELNFFIPNVEMYSGKRLQPYYDKADRPLVDNFKKVINHEYQLSDPDDPLKQQGRILDRNTPKTKQELVTAISERIDILSRVGLINSREDVLGVLKEEGFDIARITNKSISIKDPEGGQNIRLKGTFYEQEFRNNKTLDEGQRELTQNNSGEPQGVYGKAKQRLESEIGRRTSYNQARYREFGESIQSRAFHFEKYHSRGNEENSRVDPSIGREQSEYNRVVTEQQAQVVSNLDNSSLDNRDIRSMGENLREQSRDRGSETADTTELQDHQSSNPSNQVRATENQSTEELINDDTSGRTFIEHIKEFGRDLISRASGVIDAIKEIGGRIFSTQEREPTDERAIPVDETTVRENERTISENEPTLQREEMSLRQQKSMEKELV